MRYFKNSGRDLRLFCITRNGFGYHGYAILPELEEWRNRSLKACYAFLFVDCMYVTFRSGYEAKEYAVYTILGYDLNGHKDILGLWLSESESKNYWMQIFDEIKARGVEDVFFMSLDGVSV